MIDYSEGRDINAEWRAARLEELTRRAAEEAAAREQALRARLAEPSRIPNPRSLRNVALLLDAPAL